MLQGTPDPSTSGSGAARPYLVAAVKASVWIRGERRRRVGQPVTRSLCAGVAGELLFFAELHGSTGDEEARGEVRAIADDLAAHFTKEAEPGLYTGLAGQAFALAMAWRVTADPRDRDAAVAAFDHLVRCAKPEGQGVVWNNVTDVFSGSAGIGLALLWAARALDRPALVESARGVGDRLLEVARPREGGLSWDLAPGFPNYMPNFSHGTAGVAFFLARLHEATGEARYLKAAKRGAAHLMEIGNLDGLVYHHAPGGTELYYLGWCHGPAGTSRLFVALSQGRGESRYGVWLARGVDILLRLLSGGLPERRMHGFWNNRGLCCGDASLVSWLIDLHHLERAPEQLAAARKLADHLLARAEPDGDGFKWTFAEYRDLPGRLEAQTCLMQGAAGIGLALLWLDGLEQLRPAIVRMPDAPSQD
ncbi:lanthionine synthetase LanC family protein [Corallococcus silvisoli]|uniref:lanthionine synthetase LanC family protein n=1 Tax=Corallococcus silvisoli TaxID=2697031 RepID=UPI001376A146|nr:lanthionine synthetase LanC family protein [Corallococcus silvisoli]NBD12962.1 hypothetical protein [Corallococcus silvisoli]